MAMTTEERAANKHAYMRRYLKSKDHREANKIATRRYWKKHSIDPTWKAARIAKLEEWRLKNPERYRAAQLRREVDLNRIIKKRFCARITESLKRDKATKSARTESLLGCTVEFLKGYLEARFLPGMTWANRGKWHIDHHIPCVEFDLRDPVQQRQCFHYSNLRPLWAADNQRKRSKRPPTHQAELI